MVGSVTFRISSKDSKKARHCRTSLDDPRTDHVGGGRVRAHSPLVTRNRIIWFTRPHLVRLEPPTELLAHCHSLSVCLTFIGSLLAFTGTICFMWDRLSLCQ